MAKIKGICIQSYQDEDDVDRFEEGEIERDEIRVYSIGDEHDIVDGCYNKEFWKPKTIEI
jgi:hypothetical protein